MKYVIKERWKAQAEAISVALQNLSAADQSDSVQVIDLVSQLSRLIGDQKVIPDSRLYEGCTKRIRYALRKLYEQSARNLNQETYQSFKQVCEVTKTFLSCFEQSRDTQREYSKTLLLAKDCLVRLAKNAINDNKSAIQSKGDSGEKKRAQMEAYVELVSSTPVAIQKREFIRMVIADAINFNTDNASLNSDEFFGMVRDVSKLLAVIGTERFESTMDECCRGIVRRLEKSFVDLKHSSNVDSYQLFLSDCQAVIELLLVSRIKQTVQTRNAMKLFVRFVDIEDIHSRFYQSIKQRFGGNAKNIALKTLEHFSAALQDICILHRGKDVRLVDLIVKICANTAHHVELSNTDIQGKSPKDIRWIKKFEQAVLYQQSKGYAVQPLPTILQDLCTAAQAVIQAENVPTLSNPQQLLTTNFQSGCRAFNDTVDSLKRSRLEVLSEHLLDCGIRLDIVVRTLDHKLAYLVEVDGPQHFDALGQLRLRDEFTLAAATQELENQGYVVKTFRVKSSEVNSVKVNVQTINIQIMSAYPKQPQKPQEVKVTEPITEKRQPSNTAAEGTLVKSMLDASVKKKSKDLPSKSPDIHAETTSTAQNPTKK